MSGLTFDISERRVSVHRPQFKRIWESGAAIFVVFAVEGGAEVTLYMDTQAFRDLLQAGRRQVASHGERLRADLAIIEELAEEVDDA